MGPCRSSPMRAFGDAEQPSAINTSSSSGENERPALVTLVQGPPANGPVLGRWHGGTWRGAELGWRGIGAGMVLVPRTWTSASAPALMTEKGLETPAAGVGHRARSRPGLDPALTVSSFSAWTADVLRLPCLQR